MENDPVELASPHAEHLRNAGHHASLNHRLACAEYYERVLATPRYQEKGRLLTSGHRSFSQNDEDGILCEIFRRVGVDQRRFFEIGVEGGFECNTAALLLQGWTGTWVEAEPTHQPSVNFKLSQWLEDGSLAVHWQKATPDNINELVSGATDDGAFELDLLSIDVDGHDYWIWNALESRPRVIMVEYNGSLHPPLSVVVPFDPERVWDGTTHYGASLCALEKLGRRKGYSLVGCCFSGINAFFVRDDLVQDHFCAPFTAENHFEPPRFFMTYYPSGHPKNLGPYEQV